MTSPLKTLFSSVFTNSTNEGTRATPVTDESLYIETVRGDIVTVTDDNWVLNNDEGIVYIDLHNESQVDYTPHSLITHDPPQKLHIPVQTLTAADNVYEKTESIARIPKHISRYSYVTNTSNNPEQPHDFSTDLLEIWVDNPSIRLRTEQ